MEIKTYTADNIRELTHIKAWKRLEEPTPLWQSLGITLTPEQQTKVKFAPIPEMVVLENPRIGRYEGWRTPGGSWTTIFALTPKDEVVCLIEYKHGVEEVIIGLPAGTIKKDEDLMEALRRELLEETGFTAKKIEALGDPIKGTAVSARKASARYFSFVGTNLEKTADPTPDEDEHLETAYVPLAEWLKMIDRGMIRESSAITTTFMALRKLGRL